MTLFSIEEALISWLPDATGLPAYAEVPSQRPQEFLTVERVGGPTETGIDRPAVAIQVWAASRARAEEIALDCRQMMAERAAECIPQIRSVSCSATHPFPDPDSRAERYQLSLSLVTTL